MTSESNGGASTSTANQFDANFAFPSVKIHTAEQDKESTSQSEIQNSELPLLLNPPLTEEEISADLSAIINEASDLDELDMMIQSAGPFQHPRSVAQNYGHANTNMYHRQTSYHSHHHQVTIHLYSLCALGIFIEIGVVVWIVTQIAVAFPGKCFKFGVKGSKSVQLSGIFR